MFANNYVYFKFSDITFIYCQTRLVNEILTVIFVKVFFLLNFVFHFLLLYELLSWCVLAVFTCRVCLLFSLGAPEKISSRKKKHTKKWYWAMNFFFTLSVCLSYMHLSMFIILYLKFFIGSLLFRVTPQVSN